MTKSVITICVVDDDPSVCKALNRLIKSDGFRVKTYGSAQAFLNDDPTDGVDLLIIDVRMPGMNGLDLQSHLAASDHTTPIIFITAYENDISKTKAMSAGAVAYFQKPFDEKDLLGAIYKALNLKGQLNWRLSKARVNSRSLLEKLQKNSL